MIQAFRCIGLLKPLCCVDYIFLKTVPSFIVAVADSEVGSFLRFSDAVGFGVVGGDVECEIFFIRCKLDIMNPFILNVYILVSIY